MKKSLGIILVLVCLSATAQVKVIPTGIFYRILPCADCKGIETFIELNANKTGILQENYLGIENAFSSTPIRWSISGTTVTLYENDKVKKQYSFSKNTLKQIGIGEKMAPGKKDDPYTFRRLKRVTEAAVWTAKKKTGVSFIAMGNEPSWALDIDLNKGMTFSTLESRSETPAVKPQVDKGSWLLRSETESVQLNVKIESRFCTDGMSDRVYEYAVQATLNGKPYSGVGYLLNPVFALEGQWELDYLSGPRIALQWRKKPTLNFNLAEKKISGFDGCNRMMGSFSVGENNGIRFSQIAGTMMACPDNNADFFLNQFDKITRFRIVNGKLELLSGEGLLIRMKRI